VNSASDDSTRPQIYLIVQPGGLEPAPTARIGVDQQGRTAALVAQPVAPYLQPHLAVEGQVGILPGEPQHPARGGENRLVRLFLLKRLAVEGQVAECHGPLLARGVERGGDGTVPGHAAQGRGSPGCPPPWGSEDGWLRQAGEQLGEAQAGAKRAGVGSSRVSLAGQDPRKRDEAD